MRREIHKLSAIKVKTAKEGRYGDGAGLYLIVSESGSRNWVYRFTFKGKVREMGLGSGLVVTLAQARDKAAEARALVANGRNPIEVRREFGRAIASKPTFGQIADEMLAARSSQWRNAKHAAQWRMTLTEYAEPLRSLPVDAVDMQAVLACLKPHWQARPETASRLRNRIEAVLDAARSRGHIDANAANPARWKGNLDHWLPRRSKLARGHHAALPYDRLPSFVEGLRARDSVAALALEFIILTASRLGEALGATWDEIDRESVVWTIQGDRMKAGRLHRVPLSGRALAILDKLAAIRSGELVFPGHRRGRPPSGAAFERMMVEGATIHGFRSSFRDWCGEVSSFPREIAESALAHVSGDATEQAYRRGDALEKRRELMQEWAAYCEPKASNVIAMGLG
jgi:integrase